MIQSHNANPQQDSLRDNSQQAIKEAHRRKWFLIGTLIFIALSIAGLYIYDTSHTAKHEQLSQSYSKAIKAYNAEKDTAIVEGQAVDHTKSTQLFEEIAFNAPRTHYGLLSAIRAISSYAGIENKKEKVEKLYNLLMSASKKTGFSLLRERITISYSSFLYSIGKNQQALTLINRIVNQQQSPYISLAKFIRAKIHHQLGENEDALQDLDSLSSDKAFEVKAKLLKALWYQKTENSPATEDSSLKKSKSQQDN